MTVKKMFLLASSKISFFMFLALSLVYSGYYLYLECLPPLQDVDQVTLAIKELFNEYRDLTEAFKVASEDSDTEDEVLDKMVEHSNLIGAKRDSLLLERESRAIHNHQVENSKGWGRIAAYGAAALIGVTWVAAYIWGW